MSQISIQRAGFIPVFLGMVVLGATVALKLGVGLSHAALSSHTAVSSTMHAFVHEDNSIGLTFDDGSPVGSQDRVPPTIPPGTYTVRVIDDADIHNFHLSGPGVDMATGTDSLSSPTWTVTFQPGSQYTFWCDSHPDFMYGNFQTSGAAGSSGSGSSSSGSSSSSSSSSSSAGSGSSSSSGSTSSGKKTVTSGHASALLGTLTGTLSASGKPTLTSKGKAVSTLKTGRYTFAITDQDPKASFTIQASKGGPTNLTGATFVGKHSVTVTLTTGKWTFYTSPGKKSTSTFVVTA